MTSSAAAARGGDRGAVAVTLLLLLVLGAAGAPSAQAVTAAGRASEIGIALEERADPAREARADRSVRDAVRCPGRDVRRPELPRFLRLDGHAWPPPRAPGADGS